MKKQKKQSPPLDTRRTVRDSWKSIRQCIRQQFPEYSPSFDRGASSRSILKLSAQLGRQLPVDFAESLSCHTTGSVIPCPNRRFSDMVYSLMTVDMIIQSWEMFVNFVDIGEFERDHERVKASKGVVQQFLSPSWIPFAGNGGGDYYCIDLGPTFPGKLGQVIWVPHDSPVRTIIASSLRSFLDLLTQNFEDGLYELHDFYGFQRKDAKTFPRSEY